jgi:predicted acylesterase/phospholipase RssA/CRP-like cAMP-binding protein
MHDPTVEKKQHALLIEELFGQLSPAALDDLEAELEWRSLAGGSTLFAEGDRGDDVYIVVNGRLRVTTTDAEGRSHVLEEVGRGAAVGEIGLLTGEPRAATIVAVRDSDLLRLSLQAFDRLLDRHPRAMMQIARAAAMRLRNMGRRPVRAHAPRSFALVAASPDVPLAAVAARLAGELGREGGVLCLSSTDLDRLLARPGIAQATEDDAAHARIVAWLSAQERDHAYVILVADAGWTPWTRRCLRQADRVLLVAAADHAPAPGRVEQELAALNLPARCELVLVHPDGATQPTGTAAWLAERRVDAHHHLRVANDADARRLARRVSGRATAVVLGGGGARGFAHIGALRAFAEAGIEIDLIGGTSIGSVIAAGHAAGRTPAEMVEVARAFASKKALLDRTLPIVSLMAGRKLTKLYLHVYGARAIEDLWTPFFAVSSGLSNARAVVHRSGLLWRAVRASTAVPAIFPPLLAEDGEVLVDGNVMNNMPLDVMREWCEGGTLIGVNPMPVETKVREYRFGPSVSGWEALKGRFRLFGSTTRAPGIFGAIMRATEINSASRMRQPAFRALADLLIEPPVGDVAIMDYGAFEPIIELGYRSARDAIARWQAGDAAAPA